MANLRLKEQPPETCEPHRAKIPSRFAQPQPAPAGDRILAALKHLIRFLLFAVAAIAAFLITPFRGWDQYEVWQSAQETLAKLETQPDSVADMQRLHAIATAAGILWSEPAGPRPDKWYQRLQRDDYDAAYSIIQTLALGSIRQGGVPFGIAELGRLERRTDSASVPNLPAIPQLQTTCDACRGGKTETACSACNGQGWKTMAAGGTSGFALNATLKNTRKPNSTQAKRDTQRRQSCLTCQGTGKQTKPCPSCGGQINTTNLNAVPGLIVSSVQGALANIQQGMTFWRPIHTLANVQRSILGDERAAAEDTLQDNASSASPRQPVQASDPFAHIRTAAEALLATPLSEPDAQTLADIAKTETAPPELRNLAMSACGLSLLLRNKTGDYARACAIQKDTFPEPAAPTFTESDYIVNCKDCDGKGEKLNPCPHCMNPAAANSKNATACSWCKGKKTMLGRCIACNGEKKTFQPSDRVRTAYSTVLTQLIACCNAAVTEVEQETDDTPFSVAASPRVPRSRSLLPVGILIVAALPISLLTYFGIRRKR